MDTRAWNVIHDARRCQRPILNIRGQRKLYGGRRMFIDYVRITVHADLIALPYGISAFYRKVYTRNLPYFITDAKADNICKIIQEYHLKAPVYVGDTLGDFNATKTAGIPFVFASYGFGQVPSPDYTIHCPGDLLNIF